jgi:hypothetical protein
MYLKFTSKNKDTIAYYLIVYIGKQFTYAIELNCKNTKCHQYYNINNSIEMQYKNFRCVEYFENKPIDYSY